MAAKKMKLSVEVTVTHRDGPIRDGEAIGDALAAVLVDEVVQFTTEGEAFPRRSSYVVSDVEFLEVVT